MNEVIRYSSFACLIILNQIFGKTFQENEQKYEKNNILNSSRKIKIINYVFIKHNYMVLEIHYTPKENNYE